jgi:DnaK suppressor protein
MSRKDALLKLKHVLVTRRNAIRAALQGDLTALHQLALASGDLADAALDSAHEEVTSQMAEVESRELAKIDDAIARITDGSYGGCEGCGKPIPLARLQALPYATLCIKCQVKLEESGYKDWSELSDSAYDSVQN